MTFERPASDRTVAMSLEELAPPCKPGSVVRLIVLTMVLLVHLVLGSEGCEPRLDARDDARLGASLAAMTARMNQEEKLQFVFDCIALMDQGIRDQAMAAGGVVEGTEAFQPIQGLTVIAIRDRSERVGQALPNRSDR